MDVRNTPFVRFLNCIELRNHCSHTPPSVVEAVYRRLKAAIYDPKTTRSVVPCGEEIGVALRIEFVSSLKNSVREFV
jgi:hypothetical protein